jgi:hypothetical protein
VFRKIAAQYPMVIAQTLIRMAMSFRLHLLILGMCEEGSPQIAPDDKSSGYEETKPGEPG